MSTTVSLAGGLPDGLGIFGFFFVVVPTAFATFVTAALGLAKVGGFAGASVVVAVVVEALVLTEELGISAVLVPPPHAARPTHAAASAGHLREFLRRITAGNPPPRGRRRPRGFSRD